MIRDENGFYRGFDVVSIQKSLNNYISIRYGEDFGRWGFALEYCNGREKVCYPFKLGALRFDSKEMCLKVAVGVCMDIIDEKFDSDILMKSELNKLVYNQDELELF